MRQVHDKVFNRPDTNESNFIFDESRLQNYEYNEIVKPREGLEARQHFWKVNQMQH